MSPTKMKRAQNVWTSVPILEAVSRILSCRSLEHSTSRCQQVWIERFRTCPVMSHVEWLLSEKVERKRMRRVNVFGGIVIFAPCVRGGSSRPTVFVGAVVGCIRCFKCLFRGRLWCRLVARVGSGVNVSKVRFSSAAAGVQSRSGVSPKPDALGTWPHDQLSGILRLKGVSTSGCAFSAMALPAPRGTEIGVSSTEFINNRVLCAQEKQLAQRMQSHHLGRMHCWRKTQTSAVIDLACVPHVSHVWEAMTLIEKHTSLRHCA